MMVGGQTREIFTDSHLIEAGIRSALVSLGQMLLEGSLVLRSQDFIPSPAAARSCLQQLRCDGVEIVLSLSGRITGTFILALDHKAAQQLITALTGDGTPSPAFNAMARSALKEAGNIVASAFLGAVEGLSGRGGLPGVPELLLNDSCHRESEPAEESRLMCALPLVLVAQAGQKDAARGGVFILLPSDDSALPCAGL